MKGALLRSARGFLLDMDGTVYLGEKALPGAHELLAFLRSKQIDYLFVTNNSSRSAGEYAEKLRGMGFEVAEQDIFTSGEATARFLLKEGLGERLFLVGTPSLEASFAAHGFQLVEQDPDVVVLGFDTTLTYAKLWRLCDLVRLGLPFIATHPDLNCPTAGGFMPDIGATLAYVEASTGRQPDVIVGKPHRPMVDALIEETGLPAEQLCMVGDRLYTDVALGRWGLSTVLVLTGETKRGDLCQAEARPDLVVEDLQKLVAVLKGLG